MEPKKLKFSDILLIGLAVFATYFGAGNLIFPPMLGLESGTAWPAGAVGMVASAIGLPILALVILGRRGSVQQISRHIHPNFFNFFIGIIIVLCCCVTIPRTAAVGIEMGLQGIWPNAPYLPFVIGYFIVTYLFAKERGSALDKVSKLLTPVMTVILFALVVKGALRPMGTPAAPTVDRPFLHSFLGGYNTGDVLVTFLMVTVFFDAIRSKGYEGHQLRQVNLWAGLVAALCLMVIYIGLLYMGACVSNRYAPDTIGNANLLLTIVRMSGGQLAVYGLCISVLLACLTTAIGQVAAVADFFETLTHGRLPYRILVIAVPVVTTVVASFGLDKIVVLTAPWFTFTYPIALVLMVLGLFEPILPNDRCYQGAIYATIAYGLLELPHAYGITLLDPILNHVPLYTLGFGWILPAVFGFLIGLLVGRLSRNTD